MSMPITLGYLNVHQSIDSWAQCQLVSTVQCTLTFSLGKFPGYYMWDWLWYPGLSPFLVSIAFPFVFHISVFFHSPFFTCHWISFVFLLYGRRICIHSIDPSLTHFYVSFQAWDWLWDPMS